MNKTIMRLAAWGIFTVLLLGADRRATAADLPPALVPWPKTVQIEPGKLQLTAASRIVTSDPKLVPLAEILVGEIDRISGVHLKTATDQPKTGDIVLALDGNLKGEAYHLNVGGMAKISAGTYRGVVWGTDTLVQACQIANGQLQLPRMNIADDSDIKLRSAEIDIARKWFPIENLYELIDLFSYYKINHIMFHLNDHGQFTFGTELFPELPTVTKQGVKHYYTKQQLKDLVAYADARGVTIIPEIEMPQHSDAARLLPKIFGTKDAKTGEYVNSGLVNITRDDTVAACEKLVNEVMDVFSSSEYVSIGADEVGENMFKRMSEYPQFLKNHPGELPLEHLISEMDNVAKKRGKTLMIYARGGPKDVLQMPWVGNDNDYAKRGYMILPYSTGSVTHHMPTFMVPPYNTILLYSGFEPGYDFDFTKTKKIEPQYLKQVAGIQILSWQHWHYMAFFDLRKTMASVSENAWNYDHRNTFKPFAQWRDTMWARANARLDDLVFPVKFATEGLLSPGKDIVFYKSMTVKLSSPHKGTIHYRQEKLDYWNPPALPTMQSPVYSAPITITEPTVIYARLFDENGQPIGYGTERHYFPIEPKVACDAYPTADLLKAMSTTDPKTPMPIDPAALAKLNVKPTYHFPLGRLTFQPSYEGVYQQGWYYTMKGQINIPADGDYQFQTYGNESSLSIDGKTVASIMGTRKKKGKLKVEEQLKDKPVHLTKGLHDFEVIAVSGTNSRKVVEVKGPGEDKPHSLDDLMVLLPQYATPNAPK